jgi:hypothetical protein
MTMFVDTNVMLGKTCQFLYEFSWQWVWALTFGIWQRVLWKTFTDVSEERIPSIFSPLLFAMLSLRPYLEAGNIAFLWKSASFYQTIRRHIQKYRSGLWITYCIFFAVFLFINQKVNCCEILRILHCLDNRLTDGGKVVSLTCRPRLTLRKIFWYFVLSAKQCSITLIARLA